jgi:SAM-dependent methyltransferase
MRSSEMQGKLWGAEPENYTEINEPINKSLWEVMLASAKVGKDTRFLDAGCGAGGACVLAAGLGAKVTGLDASEALVNIARQRVPNGEFRVGDIEELPYKNNSFDVCFSSQTLYFADNPNTAVHEMKRVTIPNGRVVIGIWGAPEYCDLARLGQAVRNAVSDSLPNPPPKPPPTFSLSGPGLLEGLMEQAGLKISDSEELDQQYEYSDLDNFWQGMKTTGPVQGLIRLIGKEKAKEALSEAGAPLQDSKGAVKLKNRVRYVIATS